ncbi:hypothetical protein V6Z11_D04G033800 [Gossypium hirsutum]
MTWPLCLRQLKQQLSYFFSFDCNVLCILLACH